MLLPKYIRTFCATLCLFGVVGASQAAGLLTPTNSQLPKLNIQSHDVNVIIEDGYAITQVDQVFRNPHAQDLEAIYSFPVPLHGSVAEFTIWIDGKPVTGEVLEREQARQIYEEEKAAGRDAGLAEKDEYRTFDIFVSPVRAGQDAKIRLVYLQPAHMDSGVGRYVYPLEDGGVDEKKMAFWSATEAVQERFSFNLELKSAYPVEALRLPQHSQAQITQSSAGDWQAGFQVGQNNIDSEFEEQSTGQNTAVYNLDQDIVVYWRHQANLPGSVDLVVYKPEGENRGTFMLTVTPGDDLKAIQEGVDWTFVLDISGSMNGKYATLADGVQQALKKLRTDDRFRIVLFNNQTRELTRGFTAATPEQVAYFIKQVGNVQPGGGTNLYGGLLAGINKTNPDRTSAVILVTDGVANVGETKQRKFIDLLKTKDIRLFTFIMGNSANQPMLTALTKASNGFAVNVSNSDDIVGQILLASSKVTYQALHGVEVDISGIKTADFTPTKIGSLYRGQQLIVFGHYWGGGMANVTMKGEVSGEKKEYRTVFNFPVSANENPELERLWAYAKIEDLMSEIQNFGENADIQQAVTDLGIEYGLVTDYTSMIVLRDEVFSERGIERKNQQRLATEQAAQQQRGKQPSTSNRVDTQQPMFTNSRSDVNGGAFGIWMLLIFLPLVFRVVKMDTSRRLSTKS